MIKNFKSFQYKWSGALWIVPMLYFLTQSAKLWVDVPMMDEYRQTLEFQTNLTNLDFTASAKSVLLSFHNGHHLPIYSLVSLLSVHLLGGVNFELFAAIGCLIAIFCFKQLTKLISRQDTNRPFYVIVASLVFFTLSWWENITMGSQAFNFNLNLLALIGGSLAISERRPLAFVIWTTIACWTCANGLVLVPLSLIALTDPSLNISRIRRISLCVWLFALVALYLLARHLGQKDMVANMPYTLWQAAHYFLVFTGNWASLATVRCATLAGALMWTGILGLFVILQRVDQLKQSANLKKTDFRGGSSLLAMDLQGAVELISVAKDKIHSCQRIAPCSLLLSIFGTSVLITLSRAGLGVEQALSSRYSIYSAVIIICLLAMIVHVNQQRNMRLFFYATSFFAAILLFWWHGFSRPSAKARYRAAVVAKAKWGSDEPLHVYPEQLTILSKQAYLAWSHKVYSSGIHFTIKSEANSAVHSAIHDAGTVTQTIVVPSDISLSKIGVLLGTYGGCKSGSMKVRIKSEAFEFNSDPHQLLTISDNTFVETIIPDNVHLSGKVEISFVFTELTGADKISVWCGAPGPLHEFYSDAESGAKNGSFGACLNIGLRRK
jgi:hypothetical protein